MISALLLVAAIAVAPMTLEPLSLHVDGRIVDLAAHDLNGDDHPELIVSYNRGFRPDLERRLAVFCGTGQNSFYAERAAIDEPAPADAALLGTGTVAGRPALCFDTGREVRCRGLRAGCSEWDQPTRLAPGITTLFRHPESDDLPFAVLLRDMDDNGVDDLLRYTAEGIQVIPSVGAAARPEDPIVESWTIESAPHAYVDITGRAGRGGRDYQVQSLFRVPRMKWADYNGDGRDDLILLREEYVALHLRGMDGRVSAQADLERFIDIRTETEKRYDNANVLVRLADFNGDGRVDLLVNKVSGGIREMVSTNWIFINGEAGWPEEPTQTLRFDGYSSLISILDLDGDGAQDMVLPRVEIGIWKMARVLMTGSLDVDFFMHRWVGDRLDPAGEVVFSREIGIDLDRGATIDGMIPSFTNDLNGDGRPDAIAGEDNERLQVFLGGPEGFPQTPSLEVERTLSSRYGVRDLNRDGRDDLYFYWEREAEREGRIDLLLSRVPPSAED